MTGSRKTPARRISPTERRPLPSRCINQPWRHEPPSASLGFSSLCSPVVQPLVLFVHHQPRSTRCSSLHPPAVPDYGFSSIFPASAGSTSVDLLYSTSFRRLVSGTRPQSPLVPVSFTSCSSPSGDDSLSYPSFRHLYWFLSPVPGCNTSTRFRHQ